MIKLCLAFTFLFTLASCGSQPVKPSSKPAGFGIYGNWCGPDHPKDMNTAALPINELDASCMRHDMCYAALGKYECECDKILSQELETNILANNYPAEQKYYAHSFRQYFKGSWCSGTPDSKIGASRALQNIYNTTSQKAVSIYDHIVGETEDNSKEASAPVTTSTSDIKKKK